MLLPAVFGSATGDYTMTQNDIHIDPEDARTAIDVLIDLRHEAWNDTDFTAVNQIWDVQSLLEARISEDEPTD